MTEAKRRFARYNPDFLLLVVDLLGTYVFAVEGAMTAIRANLDLLGCWSCRSRRRWVVGLFATC